MSYLNNDGVTVDAILTKRGRELFSKGLFRVSKFALADDEIDYRLYDRAHPSGSDYYASAILNLPILEAIPDGSKVMKYKLVTLPKNTAQVPLIILGLTSVALKGPWPNANRPAGTQVLTPQTVNGLNSVLGYTATLHDPTYVQLSVQEGIGATKQITNLDGTTSGITTQIAQRTSVSEDSVQPGVSLIGKSFLLTAKFVSPSGGPKSTAITITGNEAGGSITIPISISHGARG